MRLRPALIRWVSFLLLLQCLALPQAFGQHSTPIKKKGLTEALATGGLSVAELTKIIEERGVDFRLTYDNEDELRKAGATDPILDAVRKHYRHAPAPPADRAKAANLVKSSRALFDAHNPTSALPVVNEALDLDPDNADAYILRAQIYYANGDANRGQADANVALQIAPNNRDAKQVLQSGKGPEIAAASPNNSTTNNSTNGIDLPAAGRAGFLGFRMRQKNGVYVVVATLPYGSAARGGIVTGDVALSANGIAFKDFFDQYLTPGKLAPGQTVNMQIQRQGQTLALPLVAMPRPNAGDEAITYYGRMIQQFPGNAEAYLYRAASYAQVKNYPPALADVNTYVRLNPGDSDGFALRAGIKDAMGDKQGAQADLAIAQNLNGTQNAQTDPSQGNAPQNNGGNQNTVPPNNNNAAVPAFPVMWTLLEYNQAYKLTQDGDHFYFQGIGVLANGDAAKTTDKKGNVIYKGKWHLTNANGTVSVWNFVLKKVTPQRMEGTVLTLGFTGQAVTFVPR
ncbi:MAG: tetratricopeptide repeat protein [Candidatus Acidiferrum sp.]|jgi:tetratricopeptide (TPR) repeat protein